MRGIRNGVLSRANLELGILTAGIGTAVGAGVKMAAEAAAERQALLDFLAEAEAEGDEAAHSLSSGEIGKLFDEIKAGGKKALEEAEAKRQELLDWIDEEMFE